MISLRNLGALLLTACLALTACSEAPKPAFLSTDVTGAPIGGPFTLTDHHGKQRRLEEFKGKVVVVFFGYTQCPDVCPTTMSELKAAMAQLGDKAKQVQVLFVTVDPERDTQALLSQYVPAFHPDFLGLRGTPAEIRAVTDRFRIVFQRNGSDATNYTVDHSAGSYILDREGKLRLFVSYGAGAKVFSHDIGLLL